MRGFTSSTRVRVVASAAGEPPVRPPPAKPLQGTPRQPDLNGRKPGELLDRPSLHATAHYPIWPKMTNLFPIIIKLLALLGSGGKLQALNLKDSMQLEPNSQMHR